MCVQSEPGKYRTVRSLLYEKKTANKKKILPSSELFETAPIKEWKLATSASARCQQVDTSRDSAPL